MCREVEQWKIAWEGMKFGEWIVCRTVKESCGTNEIWTLNES